MTTFVQLFVAAVASLFAAQDEPAAGPSQPIPYNQLSPSSAPSVSPVQTVSGRSPLSAADMERVREGLRAARGGEITRAEALAASIEDPVARKLVQWANADVSAEGMSFFQLDAARRDLNGWPRGQRRQEQAERRLAQSGQDPARVVAWFGAAQPQTGWGALALATALQQTGRAQDAATLIRSFWRDQLFDSDVQELILTRFGGVLTQDDHVARLNTLLLGPQGPATRRIMDLVSADHRTLAEARIALRNEASDANSKFAAVPASLANDPGLAFERARYLRRKNLDTMGFALLERFPQAPAHSDGAERLYAERRAYMLAAIRAGDWRSAYNAMAGGGFRPGEHRVEAEFFAGWIALKRLNNPQQADLHFQAVQSGGTTPITQGRALYWRGRAAEAMGAREAAQAFYVEGAKHFHAFYGQLAAEKAGLNTITLPAEARPTEADRARFEGRDMVRALRIVGSMGERELFRAFLMHADDALPSAEEYALLHDLAQEYGDQDSAMRVTRTAGQRGFILPERGYPIRPNPPVRTSADHAFVLAITRQESGFDPRVRSHANARGMMQLIPPTARGVARRMGEPYSENLLWDADYNMRLGAFHLGELLDQFGGSYIMAASGYNAGPGRPNQWVSLCGDPRGGTTDPVDFIECVPFIETRNYMMRVMENTQIYRARLNGGTARITPLADLKRGGYYASTGASSAAAN